MKPTLIIFSLGVAVAMTGCTTRPTSGPVYSPWQLNTALKTQTGTVLSIRKVTIAGTSSPTGRWAGGAIGGGVGSLAGRGYTRVAAAGIASGVGMIVGPEIEKMITAKPGLEITVKLDNGDIIVVIQEEDFSYRDGDIVTVLSGRGYTRVLP